MKHSFKKLLVATTVVASMGAVSGIASADPALPDFTIDINPVSGPITTQTLITADKIIGNYHEVLTVTSFDPIANTGTFSTVAYYDASSFVANDGTLPIIAGVSKLGVDYSIYALFTSTGTIAANGIGGFDFVGGTGAIDIYLDQANDSAPKVLPATGLGSVTIPNTVDDKALASATLSAGSGRTSSDPLASGDFGLTFNPFVLTGLGSQFFYLPQPFYMEVLLKGQFNSFVPAAGLTQQINGSADAFFNGAAVPEPASLTLLGLGLVGSAMARRKKKNQKA